MSEIHSKFSSSRCVFNISLDFLLVLKFTCFYKSLKPLVRSRSIVLMYLSLINRIDE